jgi:dTDP-4-dehydrorhamnose 3,5-epimerase
VAVIEGVRRRALEPHVDERGSLTELVRSDWPEFTSFGQAILTVNEPGVIRGWHWHHEQTDVIVVITGRVVIPLYDGRAGSPTHGAIDEHLSDEGDRFALFVPPGVYHGYRTLGTSAALIVNVPDRVYDPARPDEVRIDPFSPEVPYAWPAPASDPA